MDFTKIKYCKHFDTCENGRIFVFSEIVAGMLFYKIYSKSPNTVECYTFITDTKKALWDDVGERTSICPVNLKKDGKPARLRIHFKNGEDCNLDLALI